MLLLPEILFDNIGLDKQPLFHYLTSPLEVWGRSEVWLSRRPVKPEIAGSIPVAPENGL
jgi:hypothetical protein